MKNELIKEIQKVLKQAFELAFAGHSIDADSVEISYTDNLENGHLTTNLAMKSAKLGLGMPPKDIAQSIVNQIKILEQQSPDGDLFANVEVAGPGFINIWLNPETFFKIIDFLSDNQKNLAKSDIGKGQHYIVEYSSPNIAKPFSIGHLRSTIIGDAVANLLESQGYTVYRDNHLGDWGSQFGKLTFAIQKWSSVEALEKSEDIIKDLLDLYIKYHDEEEKDEEVKLGGPANFKKLEEGDPEIKALWQKCIDWSFAYFDEIYKKLRVAPFTENGGKGYGESFFEDKMQVVLDELKEKLGDNYKFNDGAWLVFFAKETKLPPLMIMKSDGSSLYSTRDLATDKFRLENYPKGTKIINEVGSEQSLYLKQIFETEKMLGWYKDGERVHLKHGLYRLPDGKMSTRKGKIILVEDVISEAIEKSKAIANESEQDINPQEVAEIVGIGAIKFNDLKRNTELDIVFDWDEVLALKGFSGPYIQYMYARCQSIWHKSGLNADASIVQAIDLPTITDAAYQLNKEEQQLLITLFRFKEVVQKAATTYSPALVCNYLYELSQQFSTFYANSPVLNAEEKLKKLRLCIVKLTAETLKQGLNLLGIETLEQM